MNKLEFACLLSKSFVNGWVKIVKLKGPSLEDHVDIIYGWGVGLCNSLSIKRIVLDFPCLFI